MKIKKWIVIVNYISLKVHPYKFEKCFFFKFFAKREFKKQARIYRKDKNYIIFMGKI